MDLADAKKAAAESALSELPESGVIGLGSGSTTKLFIDEVGRLVAEGRDFRAVAGALSRRLHIAERNTTVLDEASRDAEDQSIAR